MPNYWDWQTGNWRDQPITERSPETPLNNSMTNDKLRRMYADGYAWRMVADRECEHEWMQITPRLLRCRGVCAGWLMAQDVLKGRP